MYKLDYDTCTPWDVIRRSATVHPTLFADAMYKQAKMHGEYALNTFNADAKRIAEQCGSDARYVAETIAVGALPDWIAAHIVGLGMAAWIPPFSIACTLQGIDAFSRKQIAEREPVRTV